MTDKFALIWGAGRIGRGFLADLFNAAGYHLTLVDQSVALVAQLRRAGQKVIETARRWLDIGIATCKKRLRDPSKPYHSPSMACS